MKNDIRKGYTITVCDDLWKVLRTAKVNEKQSLVKCMLDLAIIPQAEHLKLSHGQKTALYRRILSYGRYTWKLESTIDDFRDERNDTATNTHDCDQLFDDNANAESESQGDTQNTS